MYLSSILSEKCEEFRDLITSNNRQLRSKVNSLIKFLGETQVGKTYSVQDNVADYVEKRISEIWDMLCDLHDRGREEEFIDELCDLYAEIMETLDESYCYKNYKSGSWFELNPADDGDFKYAERFG